MIYFIQQGKDGPIKIGKSDAPQQRLEQLQTANPYQLNFLGGASDYTYNETDIHKKFKHLRLKGEWFKPEKELFDFMNKACPGRRERKPNGYWMKRARKDIKRYLENQSRKEHIGFYYMWE